MIDQTCVLSSARNPAHVTKRYLRSRRSILLVVASAIAVVTGLLYGGSLSSTAADREAIVNASVRGSRVAVTDPERAPFDIVPASVIDAAPVFFFGTGDNSEGYYAERPTP